MTHRQEPTSTNVVGLVSTSPDCSTPSSSEAERHKEALEPEGRPGGKSVAERMLKKLSSWERSLEHTYKTRIEKISIRRRELLEEIFAPMLSGAVITALLMVFDKAAQRTDWKTSWAGHFVEGSMSHMDMRLFALAIFLVGLTALFSGWLVGPFLRRWLVAPVFSFGHHVAMLSAGLCAPVAVSAIPTATPWEFFQIRYAMFVFTAAGSEMFGAAWYCRSELAVQLETSWLWRSVSVVAGSVAVWQSWGAIISAH
jgi:hypothetical protein